MPAPPSPMEIYKVLDRSNCRECNEATCMAFAVAVFMGRRRLDECPRLQGDTFGKPVVGTENRNVMEQNLKETVDRLKRKAWTIDLSSSAGRLMGEFCGGRLTIRILGKAFGIDSQANLYSDIHVHPWVAIPMLSYIVQCTGKPVSGRWVPFRELTSGKDWYRLFEQRCEKPLKKIADEYPGLFEDMIRLFNGRQENHYGSDISLVLHPLPRVPILICYWKPEDGLDSNLNLFFDSTAENNLDIESIYALGTGLVRMFEKITYRHGLGGGTK
jgi:hypothetical protein